MIKDLKKKGILLVASFLLLITAGVYMAFAWYTKMTSASDMTFDAARWDYSANYSVEPIDIGVYTCPVIDEEDGENGVSIVRGKAAPGTIGYAPVVLSARDSDMDVGYVLKVDKSTMSKEFRERIYFYQDPEMTIPVGTTWVKADGSAGDVMTGIIPKGETVELKIYWKWVYDLEDLQKTPGAIRTTTQNAQEFDEFDTTVGLSPDKYEPFMKAQILITGSQLKPEGSTEEWVQMQEEEEPVVNGIDPVSIPEEPEEPEEPQEKILDNLPPEEIEPEKIADEPEKIADEPEIQEE